MRRPFAWILELVMTQGNFERVESHVSCNTLFHRGSRENGFLVLDPVFVCLSSGQRKSP